MRRVLSVLASFLGLTLTVLPLYAAAPSPGECIRLKATSSLGVPLHPGPGVISVNGRLGHGSEARVESIDQNTGWFDITPLGPGNGGWIIRKYIEIVVPCPGGSTPTPTPAEAADSYIVGTWNLEHFHAGTKRGFPENRSGGPTYLARTQQDYETIAAIIESLDVKILLLQEIFAEETMVDDEPDIRSPELDRLISILGPSNYDYTVGDSGGSQHLAILYDRRAVLLNEACETNFPKKTVQRKGLFDRQPLFAHFTFLKNGQPMNDLTVVAVHLASGQRNNKNHDQAMGLLVDELEEARQSNWCIPLDENDILFAGDFNANRFGGPVEEFWDDMEGEGWDVLADSESAYSPTRLAGVPLRPKSIIDYIIVTKGSNGLQGEEVLAEMATVHTELVSDSVVFRGHASDHIPVTVSVTISSDTDRKE